MAAVNCVTLVLNMEQLRVLCHFPQANLLHLPYVNDRTLVFAISKLALLYEQLLSK